MPHVYHLSLDTGYDVSDVEGYLKDRWLITNFREVSSTNDEKVISVEVPNRRKFESYLKKKKGRERFDPRHIIRGFIYKGKIVSKTTKRRNEKEISDLNKKLESIKKSKNKT